MKLLLPFASFSLLAPWLTSCSQPFNPGTTANAMMGHPFKVDARNPWHRTGLQMAVGFEYRISAVASCDYKDSCIKSDANGAVTVFGRWFNWLARDVRCPLNPARFGPGSTKCLRVLKDKDQKDARFLTVIAAIGESDQPDDVYVIGPGAVIRPRKPGELVIFANDWPGLKTKNPSPADYFDADGKLLSRSYVNNKGFLTVTVEPR